MEKPPTPGKLADADVTRVRPPQVTTQITRTMPLAQALHIAIQNAGKDPSQAWAVFDVRAAIIVGAGDLPPPGEHFVVLFKDFTFCEVNLNNSPGQTAANEG